MKPTLTPHPGAMIARELEVLGISAKSFASNINVHPATVSRLLSGKASLTPIIAKRVAAALGGTADNWLRMQIAYDLWQLESEDLSFINAYPVTENKSLDQARTH